MRLHSLFIALVLTALLQGCSVFETREKPIDTGDEFNWPELSQRLKAIEHWELIGKINLRSPEDSVTAAINSWKQNIDHYNIDLSSTFMGIGASNISGNPYYVVLTESGEDPLISDKPDELISSVLGFPLPIANLSYWVKGIPNPETDHQILYNAQGLPAQIQQDDWIIDFSRYKLNGQNLLPGKLKLTREGTKITLAIKEWIIP